MICPFCDKKVKCIESRCAGTVVYRRYKCKDPKCGNKFTSIEKVEDVAVPHLHRDRKRREKTLLEVVEEEVVVAPEPIVAAPKPVTPPPLSKEDRIALIKKLWKEKHSV